MDVHKAIRERRSIRIFKKDILSREDVMNIIDAGRWAPTGCNKQLFEIIVIEKPELRRQMAKLSNKGIYFYDAPLVLLVLYDKSKELEPEGVAPDISALSTGALVENMLLQAHALGIGSLIIGAITKKRELKKLLKIPDCYEPMCFLFFGYPDEKPFTPPRRDANDFTHLNTFGNLLSGKKRMGPIYPNSPNPKNWRWEEYIEFKRRILHYAGSTGRCEPIGLTQFCMSLLDILSMRIKILHHVKILYLFPADGLFLRSLAWRIFPNNKTRLFALEFSEETRAYIEHILKTQRLLTEARALRLSEDDQVTFPFEDRTFDAVTCLFRLEGLPDRLSILTESWRVLKENGIMYIAFFNKWGVHNFIHRVMSFNKPNDFNKRWHWSLGPWTALSRSLLTKELEETRFKITNEYHFLDLPSILRLVVVKLSSLIGAKPSLTKSTYYTSVKARGLLSNIILLEAVKKGD